jgi:5-aminopentanamidase
MRLAAFQMVAKAGDVGANLALIEEAAAEAKRRGADIMVAPELATTGYGAGDIIRDLAEGTGGPQVSRLAVIAAERGIAIVAGFAERAGERIYNSAAFVAPNGLRAVYRKCQLYGAYERALFAPGNAAPAVIEFAGLKVGMLICFDVEFPEAARALAVAGADVILVPTAQPDGADAVFISERVVPVRAFENGIALVYADHAGADGNFSYAGRSCIAMPDGKDAARAGSSGAAVVVADYEPSRYAHARAANPYLAERRTDLF